MHRLLVVLAALAALCLADLAHAQSKRTVYGVIRCQSPGSQFSSCPADTRDGVHLVRDFSGRCRLGISWGYSRDRIWVKDGCDAEFRVGSAGSGYGYGYGYQGGGIAVCESRDFRREFCSVDTRGGVELVNQISQSPCVHGRTWWTDARGIHVSNGCAGEFAVGGGGGGGGVGGGYRPPVGGELVRCESADFRHRRCQVGPLQEARLVRQSSQSRCIEGRTWGWDRDGIWVDQGCAGQFEVYRGGRAGHGPGPGAPGYGTEGYVRCESEDFRRRHCSIGPARDVVLVRQVSQTRCIEGRTWGWNRDVIWVDGGCAGEFELR